MGSLYRAKWADEINTAIEKKYQSRLKVLAHVWREFSAVFFKHNNSVSERYQARVKMAQSGEAMLALIQPAS
jgi:hypothetical protein